MSYQFELDPKSDAAARLIADIGGKLQAAFIEEKSTCKLTFQNLAERLDTDRSHVHRLLSGYNNMTLRTLAELAWGLDREIDLALLNPKRECVNNFIGYSGARPITVETDIDQVSASAQKKVVTLVDNTQRDAFIDLDDA